MSPTTRQVGEAYRAQGEAGLRLVTGIASERLPPGPPLSCARELQQLRVEREIAAVQREMDRLQELGTNLHDVEITQLWRRKEELRVQKEELSQRVHS